MRAPATLALLLAFASSPLQAWEKEQPWTLTAFFENDLFADTDQSYTNGVRLSWIWPDIPPLEVFGGESLAIAGV